jgi:hypothetical protein
MRMNIAGQDYRAVIRTLPAPTAAQTERFARYVSRAHSWYKHLPIHPKVPFIFYLDPGAGMSRAQTRTDEKALIEITEASPRFHYTWQTTKEYRRRFGHWMYHAPYGTSFRFAAEGGFVTTETPAPYILAESGDWLSVPAELAHVGTAHVSALVHPSPNYHIWANDPEHFGLSSIDDFDAAEIPASAHLVLRRLWSLLAQARTSFPSSSEVRRLLPRQILESIKELAQCAQLGSDLAPRMAEDWDWPSDSWLAQLSESGFEAELISSMVKYTEIEFKRSIPPGMYSRGEHDSGLWPRDSVAAVDELILEERGRQLCAMTDAMYRFVKAIAF